MTGSEQLNEGLSQRSGYRLGHPFDEVVVEPGTNILVSGPPLCGKRRVAMETLATGVENDDGTIVVTTRDSTRRLCSDFPSLFDRERSRTAFVDAVTRHIGQSLDDGEIKYTESPRDLSEIGVKFSEFVQSFYTEQKIEQTRVLVDSLSTLLVYANLQTVFRFLHVFTSRIQNVDAVGLYTIESTAHDDEAIHTLSQLFDGTITVDDAGDATLSLPGSEETTGQL